MWATSQKCQNDWKILMYLLNLILLKNVKMIEKYWCIYWIWYFSKMSKWLKNIDVFIESDTSQKCQNDWKILTYYWIWYFSKMSKWLKNIDVLLNLILLKNVQMVEKYWRIIESDTSQKCQNDWKILTYYWIWYFWKMSKWLKNNDVLLNLILLKNVKMNEKYWCIYWIW